MIKETLKTYIWEDKEIPIIPVDNTLVADYLTYYSNQSPFLWGNNWWLLTISGSTLWVNKVNKHSKKPFLKRVNIRYIATRNPFYKEDPLIKKESILKFISDNYRGAKYYIDELTYGRYYSDLAKEVL